MILANLRESTRQQHEGLESVVDVMNSTFSLDDYKKLLTKFYRFYSAIEPTLPLEELLGSGYDARERLKVPALERDLAHLGILDEAKAAGKFAGIPDVSSLATAFGSCYVMEGATLGGQIITRHLKQSLGLDAKNGAAFFSSYGPNVGPMWKEFGAAITAYAEQADRDEEITEGAKATFDGFRACFQEVVADQGVDREEIRASSADSTRPATAFRVS